MTSDHDLLRRHLDAADASAFTELVLRHGGLVRAAAHRVSAPDADDVTQATFLLLARKAQDLTSHPSLAGWLYLTARQLALNARRSRLRHAARTQPLPQHLPAPAADDAPLTDLLDTALARLPDPQRQAVLLRYAEGTPIDDAARLLGLSPSALAKRAERGLTSLRDFFAAQGHSVPAVALATALITPALTPTQATALAIAAITGTATPAAAALAASLPHAALLLTPVKLAVAMALFLAATATVIAIAARTADPLRRAVATASIPTSGPAPAATALVAPDPAATPRAVAASFFEYLRARDEDRLAALVAADTPDAARALARQWITDFRDDRYAEFPRRLDFGLATWLTQDRDGNPVYASFESLTPIDAVEPQLYVHLALAAGRWRVDSVEWNTRAVRLAPEVLAPPPAGLPSREVLSRVLAAYDAAFAPAAVVPPEADLARQLESLAELERFVAAVRELRGSPIAVPEADLDLFSAALVRLRQDVTTGTLTLAAARAKFTSDPALDRVYQRLVSFVGPDLAETLDRLDDFSATDRPPQIAPGPELTLAWSGQRVRLPGPVLLPPWLESTAAYRQWSRHRNFQVFRTRDSTGHFYVIEVTGMTSTRESREIPAVQCVSRYRPDGTLEARTTFPHNMTPVTWSTFDPTGTRATFRLERSPQSDGSFRYHALTFFDPATGHQRRWSALDGLLARKEELLDPVGTPLRTTHLVHDNNTNDFGGPSTPTLEGLPITLLPTTRPTP